MCEFKRAFLSSQTSILNRCEKSTQNLEYSKTSTSHNCSTEEKDYRQLDDECENSREHFYRLKQLFHICESSTVFNSNLQSKQTVYSLDERNYHRIWDTKKHLLHTLAKLKKKIIDN